MATFDAHRKLTSSLGDEGAEAVAEYVESTTRNLATRGDLDILRAEIRGDLYRALWLQAGFVVTVNAGVVTTIVALATVFA